jgi:hypothetical protein
VGASPSTAANSRARRSPTERCGSICRRELAAECDAAVVPAAVATRTGIALVYRDTRGRLMFWHGSEERLAGDAPVPAAVRLDRPPDEVHEGHMPRA